MGLARKIERNRQRNALSSERRDLKRLGNTLVYYIAVENGGPALRTVERAGRPVQVTWVFSAHSEAGERIKDLAPDFTVGLTVGSLTLKTYLGSLFHHLGQADIDLLVTDRGQELPLTTFGVNVLADEQWLGPLEEARQEPAKNALLVEVARRLFENANPEDKTFIEKVAADDFIKLICGKKSVEDPRFSRLPPVDLGLVWMLSAVSEANADTIEPVYIKITDREKAEIPEGEELPPDGLLVGPVFFSSRDHAFDWARVLPDHIARHLVNLDMRLDAYRSPHFLEQVQAGFEEARIETREPDLFLLDGGCLPLTRAGCVYTESKLDYGEHKPDKTWVTVAEEKGPEALRKVTVRAAAHALGIRILEVPARAEPEQPDGA